MAGGSSEHDHALADKFTRRLWGEYVGEEAARLWAGEVFGDEVLSESVWFQWRQSSIPGIETGFARFHRRVVGRGWVKTVVRIEEAAGLRVAVSKVCLPEP
jgi:hypothetical protein